MDWSYEVAERDHVIQNPTSAEKIRLLGEYVRLGPGARVLDVACGKAGPAAILASTFGCSITGLELRSEFAAEARARIAEQGCRLSSRSMSATLGTIRSSPRRGTSRSASALPSSGGTSATPLHDSLRP